MSEMTDGEIKKLIALLESKDAQMKALGKKLQRVACLKSQMELISQMYPPVADKNAVYFTWLLAMYPIDDLQCRGDVLKWEDIEAWIGRNPGLMPRDERRGKFLPGRNYKIIQKKQTMDPLSRISIPYLKLMVGTYSKATNHFNAFSFGKITKDSIIAVAEL